VMPEQLRIFPYRAVLPSIDNVLDADDVAAILENEEIIENAYLPNPFPKMDIKHKMLWSLMSPEGGINSVLDVTDVYDYILPMPDEIIEKVWSAIV